MIALGNPCLYFIIQLEPLSESQIELTVVHYRGDRKAYLSNKDSSFKWACFEKCKLVNAQKISLGGALVPNKRLTIVYVSDVEDRPHISYVF